jgi:phosphoribosylaminoimidazole-succinocarboxamide synthase
LAIEFNNNRTLYEELSKRDLALDEENYVILEYSDYFIDNGEKKFKSKNLGEKFASINSFFMDYLKEYHIPTAFIKPRDRHSLKFLKHTRFPFSVKIYNTVDQRTAKIFGKDEKTSLSLPIQELHYGHGSDNCVSESHLISFGVCTPEDLKLISRICSKVNAVLKSYFERRNIILAQINCCFGKADDKIYLVDDFTPRSIKIYSATDDKKLDPNNFTSSNEIKKYTDHLFSLTSL